LRLLPGLALFLLSSLSSLVSLIWLLLIGLIHFHISTSAGRHFAFAKAGNY